MSHFLATLWERKLSFVVNCNVWRLECVFNFTYLTNISTILQRHIFVYFCKNSHNWLPYDHDSFCIAYSYTFARNDLYAGLFYSDALPTLCVSWKKNPLEIEIILNVVCVGNTYEVLFHVVETRCCACVNVKDLLRM